jgi:deaminated glutathione amidase
MVRLSAIQLNSVPDVETNLATIRRLVAQLPPAEQHVVLLPECCLYFGSKDEQQLSLAKETLENKRLQHLLAQLALDFNITLVAGTIPVLAENGTKFYNRSCVFNPDGSLVSYYDKIHLFDVQVNDGEKNYCESNTTQAGQVCEVVDLPLAKLGLSVCYDLRFAELYRHLTTQGAEIITVPSAFTQVTGKAHWQTLLQARAIENQVYIIAAAQQGQHQNGRQTWGHSMIINPWGEILACHQLGEGFASAEVELSDLHAIRANMPVSEHNQFTLLFKSKK